MSARKRVLVLEDQMMIAHAMKDMLTGMGFETVGPYSDAVTALDALDQEEFEFALLDINLGDDETSEPVAEALLDRKKPFVFVTGYGSAGPLQDKFRDIRTCRKPVRPQDILEAMDLQ